MRLIVDNGNGISRIVGGSAVIEPFGKRILERCPTSRLVVITRGADGHAVALPGAFLTGHHRIRISN